MSLKDTLQGYGSPFTQAADIRNARPLTSGDNRPRVVQYVNVNGKITCDNQGNFAAIAFGNPFAGPLPLLTSDNPPPAGIFTGYQPTVDSWAAAVSQMYNTMDTNMPNLSKALLAPELSTEYEIVFGGVRVWNLNGLNSAQGQITGAPMDAKICEKILQDNQLKSRLGLRSSWTAIGEASEHPAMFPIRTGLFNNDKTQQSYGGLTGMFFNAVTTKTHEENLADWYKYLTELQAFAEFPGTRKIYPGVDGVSVRFGLTEVPSSNPWANVKWLGVPNQTILPDSTNVDEDIVATFPVFTTEPFDTPLWTPTLPFYPSYKMGLPVNYGGNNYGLGTMSLPVTVQKTVSGGYTSFAASQISPAGLFGSGPTPYLAMPAFDSAHNMQQLQIDSVAQGETTVGGFKVHTLGSYISGDEIWHDHNGGWTNASLTGLGFEPNQQLYMQVVWCIAKIDPNADPLATKMPIQVDWESLLPTITNEQGFPLVAKGHSFFDSLKSAITKVAGAVSTYGPMAMKVASMV